MRLYFLYKAKLECYGDGKIMLFSSSWSECLLVLIETELKYELTFLNLSVSKHKVSVHIDRSHLTQKLS